MSQMDVSAAARQEATAVYRCPFDHLAAPVPPAELRHRPPAERQQLASAAKPRIFGLLGRLIERSVEPVVSDVEKALKLGDLGLLLYPKAGVSRDRQTCGQATKRDITTWGGLARCWESNIQHSTGLAIASCNPEVLSALRSLWSVRSGGGFNSFEFMMSAGAGTAAGASLGLQVGIDSYLRRSGVSDGDKRAAIVGRSHSPITEVASLNPAQHSAFNEGYTRPIDVNGERIYAVGVELGRRVFKPGVKNGVTFSQPIEEFPTKDGTGVVGDAPAIWPGDRIGCPILLSPKLTKRLWAAYTGAAIHVRLLGSDVPAGHIPVAS